MSELMNTYSVNNIDKLKTFFYILLFTYFNKPSAKATQ